jgi:molybdopterin-containing oxidoreductase family iron-sulfur binding subunit
MEPIMKTPNENSHAFEAPRHWIAPEELSESYWKDPQVREQRGQEFHDKPIETLERIEKLDEQGIARRDFLTIMGASMAMASFACARRPVHKIIPYVVQPEEVVPGVANYYASTEPSTGYGLLIKTREGRPIKLEGNPDHPLNAGKLPACIQASLLDLYDPDRLKEPMLRIRGASGRKVPWSELDQAVVARLKTANRVRVLTAPVIGDSTRRLIGEFLSAFRDGAHVEYAPLALDDLQDAQALSYGAPVFPSYRFGEAEVVVSLGADFLGSWPQSVAHAAAWSKRRKLGAGGESSGGLSRTELSKTYCFESMMTLTGANSDERFAIPSGEEHKIALAIAHELIVRGKLSRFAGDSAVAGALAGYSASAVAGELGIENGAAKIAEIAEKLWKARGKGLVVAGGVHSRSAHSVALQVAVNLLNSALENEGSTVDGTVHFSAVSAGGFAGIQKLISEMAAGGVDVLVVHGVNPAFTLPAEAGFAEAVKKVGMVVAVSQQENETTELADAIAAEHHFLENWGDARVLQSVYSLQQPAISPIHSTRSFQDSLLGWVAGAGLGGAGMAAQVAQSAGQNTWHDYLMRNWKETVYREHRIPASFEQFWEGALREGVFHSLAARGNAKQRPTPRAFRVDSLARVPKYAAGSSDSVLLSLYASNALGDGTQANNPWLLELPDPISTVTWDNYLNVGPALAAKLGLKTHDVVEVKSASGKALELAVVVQPGMHSRSVSAAIGWGRRVVGNVGKNCGRDVYPLAALDSAGLRFAGIPVTLRKTGKSFRLAETQWHHVSENRPVINDVTLAEYRANPAAANHTDPHLRMDEVPTIWPKHEYPGSRWGMAIDLNSCIGCGACVVGCQAENNIPVVGRDNVRVSREMHWIRIDRYYSGSMENPDVLFQPMLCQHCENAPCETVCPVLATVHGDDGTNQQIYNRCVGTRYCQNNCPYKVRRFNFFDHWKQYSGTMNLAWNPDVTVRSRGIMEKCTFCVQRINEARHKAKDLNLPKGRVPDGMLQTACQQTCPTDAIVFGDMNDPKSRVSKLMAEKRAFRVLEVLNTRPSISYLSKVRNKQGKSHTGDHHV